MKKFSRFIPILALTMTPGVLPAAVIYFGEPVSIERFNPESKSIDFDFNGDGRSDFSLTATGSITGSEFIAVSAPDTTRFGYFWRPSIVDPAIFLFIDYFPLERNTILGPDTNIINLRFAPRSESALPRLVSRSSSPTPSPGEGLFVGETAYLGFSFESDLGTHYGYALLTDTTSEGTTILATAWESEPGKSIITGAIPEPSGILLLLSGAIMLGFHRRRI